MVKDNYLSRRYIMRTLAIADTNIFMDDYYKNNLKVVCFIEEVWWQFTVMMLSLSGQARREKVLP
ncbi:hypothetical protein A462_26364 [Pseudomonas sp. Ag1]|jgi:hypothetical protein|nr:hypothetical protein A462_26364 [Pseudomonas sp. Ag1]